MGGSILICFVLCWWAGEVFGIPPHRRLEISLLSQPGVLAALIVVLVLLLGCTLLGTLIAGTIRFDAGLLAACCGLSALSMRGGTMGDLLRQQNMARGAAPSIYWVLIGELTLLYGMLALTWAALWALRRGHLLRENASYDDSENAQRTITDKLLAVVTQAGVMVFCLFLLMQTDAKKQVMVSVFLAAFAGAAASQSIFSVRLSPWYWCGPLIVGLLGYMWERFSPGAIWQAGQVQHVLARALPLDYASAGPAGAILGYWASRNWEKKDEEDEEE